MPYQARLHHQASAFWFPTLFRFARLRDEADAGEAGAAGGAHRFGNGFVAGRPVGLQVKFDFLVMGNGEQSKKKPTLVSVGQEIPSS